MRLHRAIAEANASARLGLVLYLIPNFPDPKQYGEIVDLLAGYDEVSVAELTIPVREGFSSHANATIRRAHELAARAGTTPALIKGWPRPKQPTMCVLYEQTVREFGYEATLEATRGYFDGVLLEWDEPDSEPYLPASRRLGVELIQCVGPWMTTERIKELMSWCEPDPLVYLMSAEMTGADLFPAERLSDCVRRSREARPDIKTAAGFGIRSAGDVRSLHAVEGLDAVIVGTAFLDAMAGGRASVKQWLDPVVEALYGR